MVLQVTEVPAGSTPVLQCNSNNDHSNFQFWLLNNDDIIGPSNRNYDESQYKYAVLSGNLSIHNVGPEHAGYYKCFSQRLNDSARFVEDVELVVTSSQTTHDAIQIVAIVLSIIVIIGCAVLYFRLRKDWEKYDGRSVVPADEEEEIDDSEEIYNPTTTSISVPSTSQVAGPSRMPSSEQLLYGIDNQGLDTDFNSVFENIQIKSPHQSLI